MPLYEYACQKCSHVFEELVLGGATPSCPKCGTQELERLISAVGGRMGEDAASRAQFALTDYGRPRRGRKDE
jgi:putative FmdB family regulatory protein